MSSTILTQPNVRVNGAAKTTGPDIPPLHATDSEWDGKDWLATAVIDPYEVVEVNFNWYKTNPEVRARLRQYADEIGVLVQIGNRLPDCRLVPAKGCDLLNFYSPKDIQFALGEKEFTDAVQTGKIRQRNALTSQRGYGVRIHDLFGLSGHQSLKDMAATWGIPMDHKSDLDDYKDRMAEALREMPEAFLRYLVDDVRVLRKIYVALLDGIRGIEADLGLAENQRMTASNLPHTLGALVAKIFRKWLFTQAGQYANAVRFCTFKLGVLDQDHTDYEANRLHFHQTRAAFTRPEDLAGTRFPFKSSHFRYTALECCGVKYFAGRDVDQTEIYNALVQGGRCVNEQPQKLLFGPGLDPDNAGCYSSAMEQLTYPVGLPYVWSFPANRKESLTLEQFLHDNEPELLPGLYTITVSGSLPFHQDLLFSKLARAENIRKALQPDDDGDTDDIDADLVLLRRELHNTILTHDMLTALKAVATNRERKAFLALRVVTAAAYRKCDRMESAEAWCRHVMADQGGYSVETTESGVRAVDERSRAWYGVPLAGFVGKLKADRERLKKVAGDSEQSDEDRKRAGGMQEYIKLILNSLYGVMASRHFPISNTVVANNITARARLGMWMMSKVLRTAQSITDGGIYEPSHVMAIGRDRPGLNTLATMHDYDGPEEERSSRRSIHIVPLAGLPDWPQRIAEGRVPDNIDELALAHVQAVWGQYGLVYPFAIEHKRDHDFTLATTAFGKGDYTLELVSGGRKYKLRGKDKKAKDDPKFHIHDELLNGGDRFPEGEEMMSCRRELLSIKRWKQFQTFRDADKYAGYMPGDEYRSDPKPARFNNLWMPCDTLEQHRRRARRGQRTKAYEILFERHSNRGIRWVHRRMVRDQL
jgi:hypothetical protein